MSARLWLAASLLLCQGWAHATTLDELVDKGQLRLSTWITPATDIVVGEEVQLTIEVSTQRWFAGGTSIHYPEEKNLVILRRDSFANNLSHREGAITWVVQRWNLELYPQVEGSYRLPSMRLDLAVNDALAGVVRGSLQTSAVEFSARVPGPLRGLDAWLAAPSFTLEHSTDKELTRLVPGDAFTREITLRATHINSMMLPVVVSAALEGLPAYEDTPQLRDTSNRGEATAERRQSITYVVEKAGQYTLPEQVFYWWDTDVGEVKMVVLPALQIDAGEAVGTETSSAVKPLRERLGQTVSRSGLIPLLLAVLVAVLLILWWRWRAGVSETRLLRRAGGCLRRGQTRQASQLLYQWLNTFQPQPDWYSLRNAFSEHQSETASEQVNAVLANAYGLSGSGENLTLSAVRRAKPGYLGRWWRQWRIKPVVLRLNPDNSAGE